MNEADALHVLLLREIEAAHPPVPALWSAADRAWATRAALDQVGPDAGAQRFFTARARLALLRLAPRLPALPAWLDRCGHAGAWRFWAVPAAAIAGFAVDSLGGARHINLLAPPLWGVLAWNLVVYALLLVRLPRGPAAAAGRLARRVQALWALAGPVGPSGHIATADPSGPAGTTAARSLPAPVDLTTLWRAVAPAWARASAPLSLARTMVLLHALAAALALGLIGGLYLRGLVFDYRAGWQSTFLDAANVHALLSFVLAPAEQLTGLALPDVEAFAALRVGAAPPEVSAAPWIHLLAASLALFVVLPRTLLALSQGWRTRRLATDVALPLHEPYFQRLLREQRGAAAHVHLVAHAHAPDAVASAALAALIGRVLGPHVELSRGTTIEFGAEDEADPDQLVPPGTTHVLLLVDLVATPEAEHHGRLAERLVAAAAARGATPLLCLDEAAFLHRFAAWPQRATERRAAWSDFAEAAGLAMVVLDLGASGAPGAASAGAGALQRALDATARPLGRSVTTAPTA